MSRSAHSYLGIFKYSECPSAMFPEGVTDGFPFCI